MTTRHLTIPGQPLPLKRHRMTKSGRTYDPKENREHKRMIMREWMLAHAGVEPYPKGVPLSLFVFAVFKRPQRLAQKNRSVKHVARPDIDNVVKMIMDALNGLAWHDDSQVCDLRATKVYAEHGEQPHVYVAIKQVPAMEER